MSVDRKSTRKPGGGRPAYTPTDIHYSLVRALIIAGRSQVYICNYINISPKTLRKHYRELLDASKVQQIEEVETCLFLNATVKREFNSMKFYLESNNKEKYLHRQQIQIEPDNQQDIMKEIVDHLSD